MSRNTLQEKIIELKREILELKTGQAIPSTLTIYSETHMLDAGTYTNAIFEVEFAPSPQGMAPIVFVHFSGAPFVVRPYNTETNKLQIEIPSAVISTFNIITIDSNREIISIAQL